VNRLPAQLNALQTALVPSSGSGPVPAALASDIDALIRAIRRKRRFVEMHMALLVGIDWSQIDDLGRRSSGVADPTRLRIPLSEASLVIEHPGAVIDHVYLAFDGLIAAVVNMTDTLGRLVNVAYSLGIDPRKATLLVVRDRCSTTSALGLILNDNQHIAWLRKVRDLRGRCQHADIEEILTSSTTVLSRRAQPHVDQTYSWRSPAQPTLMTAYAEEAVQAAAACLHAAIGSILTNPANPIS
jgi:hypothetical protein